MNRLAQEKSPYLLQHANNPVDWYPWGDEAFTLARKLNRPIFLSVGYSTCHWCHVMAHESFENPKTAALMNALFVNIKVDREERPDVDRVYMSFVQATTGGGGWPMSVWLQPDLTPIVGGTYFPPDDRYGRRGFPAVCQSVADAWRDDHAKIVAQGERIMAALRAHAEVDAPDISTKAADKSSIADTMLQALRPLSPSFDAEWGGFGDAPKFPRPVTLMLLARIQARLAKAKPHDGANAHKMLVTTLDAMAAGGMHDHLGGGFHRYSVDRFWRVPHFEKMLYDQAQLAVAYIEGFQITQDPRYASIARDILGYVERDLRSPEGGFFCAEDADSLVAKDKPEHAEGAFYVWTKAEIEHALPKDVSAPFCAFYNVEKDGNAPEGSDSRGELRGKNVLFTTLAANSVKWQVARATLFKIRADRPRPHLDDKILVAWNGLMISAFARASTALDDSRYLQTALSSAAFIRQHLYRETDNVLLRTYREGAGTTEGFAEDYAYLIGGLLDLCEATGDATHLAWAEKLQKKQDHLFADPAGGYFSSASADPHILIRLREEYDGAEPTASSVSAMNLARLAVFTGQDDYRTRAESIVNAFGVAQNPMRAAQALPSMLSAHDFLADPPAQVVIAGPREREDTRELLRTVHHTYAPNQLVILATPDLAERNPEYANLAMEGGRATAYLCRNGACQFPTTDPAKLMKLLSPE